MGINPNYSWTFLKIAFRAQYFAKIHSHVLSTKMGKSFLVYSEILIFGVSHLHTSNIWNTFSISRELIKTFLKVWVWWQFCLQQTDPIPSKNILKLSQGAVILYGTCKGSIWISFNLNFTLSCDRGWGERVSGKYLVFAQKSARYPLSRYLESGFNLGWVESNDPNRTLGTWSVLISSEPSSSIMRNAFLPSGANIDFIFQVENLMPNSTYYNN